MRPMNREHVHAFDAAMQDANLWLKALMDRLVTEDPHFAYAALRSVLHAMRDRIGARDTAHLSAQLPMLIRGLFFEGWHPASATGQQHRDEDFLERVRKGLPQDQRYDVENVTHAVFGLLWERLDRGEIVRIIKALPEELRDLWPAATLPQR
jgi:uncharacterized protein (DUF2267 family)